MKNLVTTIFFLCSILSMSIAYNQENKVSDVSRWDLKNLNNSNFKHMDNIINIMSKYDVVIVKNDINLLKIMSLQKQLLILTGKYYRFFIEKDKITFLYEGANYDINLSHFDNIKILQIDLLLSKLNFIFAFKK